MAVDFLSNTEIKLLIDGVKKRFAIDLSVYSMTSFQRRAHVFFINHNIENSSEFLVRVEKQDRLFQFFLKEMAVSESEMFRDPDFWTFFANNILINLLSKKDQIRIWLPDSTTGEEYYTLAIILQEKGFIDRVNIIVSASNELSLKAIKEGFYTSKSMEHNKSNYVRYKGYESEFLTYFKEIGNKRQMNVNLQKNTEFQISNLLKKENVFDIDLILCRNKLLYYTIFYKKEILDIFSSSLNKEGFLSLGIKEEISENKKMFKTFNENEHIYLKK